MRKYAPRYFLVNGKAYPDTDPIATTAGSTVLLRYVNAGTPVPLDGRARRAPERGRARRQPADATRGTYVAETFGPGQTADALVTPAASTADRSSSSTTAACCCTTATRPAIGGMLTLLDVAGTGGGRRRRAGDQCRELRRHRRSPRRQRRRHGRRRPSRRPSTSSTPWRAGTGTAMTAVDGTFDSATENVVSAGALACRCSTSCTSRGQDALGNWGPFSSVLVSGGDAGGPTTSRPTLTPDATNEHRGRHRHATGDDTAPGGSNIAAAEYFDRRAARRHRSPMTVNAARPSPASTAPSRPATVNALPEGTPRRLDPQPGRAAATGVSSSPSSCRSTRPVPTHLAA